MKKNHITRWFALVLVLVLVMVGCNGTIETLSSEEAKQVLEDAGLTVSVPGGTTADTLMASGEGVNLSWSKAENAELAKEAADTFKETMTLADMKTVVENPVYAQYTIDAMGFYSYVIRKAEVFVSMTGVDDAQLKQLITDLKLEP